MKNLLTFTTIIHISNLTLAILNHNISGICGWICSIILSLILLAELYPKTTKDLF